MKFINPVTLSIIVQLLFTLVFTTEYLVISPPPKKKKKKKKKTCSATLTYTTHIAARLVHVFMSCVYIVQDKMTNWLKGYIYYIHLKCYKPLNREWASSKFIWRAARLASLHTQHGLYFCLDPETKASKNWKR